MGQKIERVAVLGAGMGAQIAALFANASIPCLLFDLASEGVDNNLRAKHSLQQLLRMQPRPLAVPEFHHRITPANYQTDLKKLADCDLIIETVSEEHTVKTALFKQIAPYLSSNAVLVTNTSGLKITQLAEPLSPELRSRFCGVHFFNPPRLMRLVEFIPHPETRTEVLEKLEELLINELGKSVVYAKNTANFIANRIGMFALLSVAHHAEQLGIMPDRADQLTGSFIGRSSTACFKTMDWVGLDTLNLVVKTMADQLQEDPWHRYFRLPEWIHELIAKGQCGRKVAMGIYAKIAGVNKVYQPRSKQYVDLDQVLSPELESLRQIKDLPARLHAVMQQDSREAKLISYALRDLFLYCAYHAATICSSVRDIDLAMRQGYGWQLGPFELWQKLGWDQTSIYLQQQLRASQCMAQVELPRWVIDRSAGGVYQDNQAFDPASLQFVSPRICNANRHHYSTLMIGTETLNEGKTLYENSGIRLWEINNDRIAIVSFKTQNNLIDESVLDGMIAALAWVKDHNYLGLIIWQRHGDHFSYGADWKSLAKLSELEEYNQILDKFYLLGQSLRYSQVPVVSAIKGKVVGFAAQLVFYATKVVAALETQIGFSETKAGIIPAAGICKELAMRVGKGVWLGQDPYPMLHHYLLQIMQSVLSENALIAKKIGYLKEDDVILAQVDELLYVAKQELLALTASHYRSPLPALIPVIGKTGIANARAYILNLFEGRHISVHDSLIANTLSEVLCGGYLEAGTMVDEDWFFQLEREAIIKLASTPQTRERVNQLIQRQRQ